MDPHGRNRGELMVIGSIPTKPSSALAAATERPSIDPEQTQPDVHKQPLANQSSQWTMSSASNNPVTKTRFHREYQRLLDGELVTRISTSLAELRQAKNSVLAGT